MIQKGESRDFKGISIEFNENQLSKCSPLPQMMKMTMTVGNDHCFSYLHFLSKKMSRKTKLEWVNYQARFIFDGRGNQPNKLIQALAFFFFFF